MYRAALGLTLALATLAAPPAPGQPILFVSNQTGTTVSRVAPGGSPVTTYATGLNNPQGLAFDAAGNLYVANGDAGTVSRVPPGGGAAAPFATGFNGPTGVAFGPDGNLYVANANAGTVSRVGPAGGLAVLFGTGFTTPTDLTFGPDGNLYVVNRDGNTVSRVGPGGGAGTTYATGLDLPWGLAFDVFTGNLYVANQGTGLGASTICRAGPGGGGASLYALGVPRPAGFMAAIQQVPEPSSLLLCGAGAAALAGIRRRRAVRGRCQLTLQCGLGGCLRADSVYRLPCWLTSRPPEP
jgi:glucose/arabinose dehydrogenase